MAGFDPFGNRLARDVRNTLSKTFVNLLERGDGPEALEKLAETLAAKNLSQPVADYIADRMARFGRAMAVIRSETISDSFLQALILWDEGLFFEVHERLEVQWMRETGERRLALQSMIRAAGVYVHLEQGKKIAAAKMASRAVEGLKRYGKHLSAAPHLAVLVEKLERLDPHPPFFFKKTPPPGVKGINRAHMADLSCAAQRAARKRVHHILHPDIDDPVQRLVIAMDPNTYFRPHRHHRPGRWELFAALAGGAAFLLFDEFGRVTERITLAAGGLDYRVLEIPAGVWHTLVVLKKGTVMLEVKEGPYAPLTQENLATWAPEEGHPTCSRFVTWFKKAEPGDTPPDC